MAELVKRGKEIPRYHHTPQIDLSADKFSILFSTDAGCSQQVPPSLPSPLPKVSCRVPARTHFLSI